MAATAALREALNQGISSGNLVDTKIILYSHRDSSGRVCRPKALYANSHVLKTVPYFKDLLFGNFAESQSRDFSGEEVGGEESAEDYGYLSDSDLEDDEDEKLASSKDASKPRVDPFIPFGCVPGKGERILCEDYEEHVEQGKIVKIPDMAFVTFQAFLMYLYTDEIEFAPFGSEENRRSRSAEIVSPSDGNVPRPSPRSIYRLADKYDVPVLKNFALNHIIGGLGKRDVVEETFSRFTSRYEEIRRLYIDQLACIWMEDSTTEATRVSFEKKIDSFVEGDLEHATEVLSALWEIVNGDEEIKAPSGILFSTAQVTSPTHWASVKVALIKSIRSGVLFDRKYWARHLRTGDTLKPVYFSSIVMSDKVQQLNKLVKYLKGRNARIDDLEGGVNVDSDCEGDSTGANDGELKMEDEETLAVLIAGSFSAWKSLFFYRCTDIISFAPLKSQGVDYRLNHIQEKSSDAAPPPCSPKTIFVLASLLGMQPLSDSAFADIKSKVASDNVMDEVFSWVTASQEKIMEMECELLTSNFKNPKTIGLIKENIGHISNGSSSYSAGALKFGFKKAFELKKQKRFVLLRCPRVGCARNTTPVPYSTVGTNVYCTNCQYNYGSYYMQCVGCSHNRTDGSYVSCQSCGKKFL